MTALTETVAEAEAVAARAWFPRQEAGALEAIVTLWGDWLLLVLLAVALALTPRRCRL